MMRKYTIAITGDGTSGAFELHASAEHGGPVWSTGQVGVAITVDDLQERLAGFDESVRVTPGNSSDRMTGVKSWNVLFPGRLWKPEHGAYGLTGMFSPNVQVSCWGWEYGSVFDMARSTVNRLIEECTDADGNLDINKFNSRNAETIDSLKMAVDQITPGSIN